MIDVRTAVTGVFFSVLVAAAAVAQEDRPKVVIALAEGPATSPMRLAEENGLFEQQGVEVETVELPVREQHMALRNGSVQAIAGPLDAQVAYAAAGTGLTQVLLLSRSRGAHALIARSEVTSVEDLRNRRIAVDEPGTSGFFLLMAILQDHGLSPDDVLLTTQAPQEAAFAFATGQFDAIVTSEPYLSDLMDDAEEGSVLLSSADYPVIVDMLAVAPDLATDQPATVDALVRGWFAALQRIESSPEDAAREPRPETVEWPDGQANQAFFEDDLEGLLERAATILEQAGVIESRPDLDAMVDTSFVLPMR